MEMGWGWWKWRRRGSAGSPAGVGVGRRSFCGRSAVRRGSFLGRMRGEQERKKEEEERRFCSG